jgi:uncharacterized membrane protein YphA (DoxX/SURF4 family)
MKTAVRIIQMLVGILFIVSGLVKANDPLGLGYKMQEFFEIWNISLNSSHFFARGLLMDFFDLLHAHSLFLSIVMITLEIFAGIALLIGWRKKFILYLLLLLIVFFTFLTGYAYLSKNPDGSPKFTNCGCFGDCLPITPATSFIKDLALLVLIVFLTAGQKYIQPVFSKPARTAILAFSLAASIVLQLWALNYLPPVDCLPFKKGNNIAEQMKPPAGAVPDSIAIRFIYEKQGRRYEFAPEDLPADYETYTYIDRKDQLIRKGNAEPRIKGFSLTDTAGQDLTQTVLAEPRSILIFALDPANAEQHLRDLRSVANTATQKNIPVYVATSATESFRQFLAKNRIDIPVLACDFTVIRTAARTNPTLYILKSGNISGKYGFRKFDQAVTEIKKM